MFLFRNKIVRKIEREREREREEMMKSVCECRYGDANGAREQDKERGVRRLKEGRGGMVKGWGGMWVLL